MDEKLGMVKMVGGLVVSIGVGTIVTNIIGCTTPANTGKLGKACIYVGGTVLGWIAKEAATTYAEKKFDETVNTIKGFMAKTKEVAA